MAVDLGGEFLKISVVRPGRPVSIAINEFSKRKTSAQVAFVNGERLLGEDAAALAPRYPDLVFGRCNQPQLFFKDSRWDSSQTERKPDHAHYVPGALSYDVLHIP